MNEKEWTLKYCESVREFILSYDNCDDELQPLVMLCIKALDEYIKAIEQERKIENRGKVFAKYFAQFNIFIQRKSIFGAEPKKELKKK